MGGASSAIARISSKSNVELTAGLTSNMEWHRKQIDPNSTSTYEAWTARSGDDLYVPTWKPPVGLSEERQAYDITVKLFYMPGIPTADRCQHAKDAISFVLRELNVQSLDLLIVSFPGITFDADDESLSSSSSDDEDDPSQNHDGAASTANQTEFKSIMQTWRTLESFQTAGTVRNIGLAEFGTSRLRSLLAEANVRPAVDQINVRDCCVVPRPLILVARREKIELLTHNDCTDILPSGTFRELLSAPEVGVLQTGTGGDGGGSGLGGAVQRLWVVKYTAVVRDRGVVENKGYFAAAQLEN
jgi:glutamate--cysteine ligase regulatory subunit